MHYYSRKKRRLWLKGEQSQHYQLVKEIFLNCDDSCLLIKVEQVAGACDLGYHSCFNRVLEKEGFSETGKLVFDPRISYGDKYTDKILLGIPSGSLKEMSMNLLELAGISIIAKSERSYKIELANNDKMQIFMFRAQELPKLVEEGKLDAALTGIDMVKESSADVRDVCNLNYNKRGRGNVSIAIAIPQDKDIFHLKDLKGSKIATSYPNLSKRFFSDMEIPVDVIPSIGATEGKVPLLADAVIDLVESGATLQANGLKPILKIIDTSVHFIANNNAWGYTWKRRNLELLQENLVAAAKLLPINSRKIVRLPSIHSDIEQ